MKNLKVSHKVFEKHILAGIFPIFKKVGRTSAKTLEELKENLKQGTSCNN